LYSIAMPLIAVLSICVAKSPNKATFTLGKVGAAFFKLAFNSSKLGTFINLIKAETVINPPRVLNSWRVFQTYFW
jgi:hypothetical protein